MDIKSNLSLDKTMKRIVSACLLGINCKYNCTNNKNNKVLDLLTEEVLIPVCPEQLGGLASPREPCEQKNGKVYSKQGEDVTKNFLKGAKETFKIAQMFGVKKAILKQRSPSCGVGQIYDGSFSGKVVGGDGITTALLRANAIEVISEEDL